MEILDVKGQEKTNRKVWKDFLWMHKKRLLWAEIFNKDFLRNKMYKIVSLDARWDDRNELIREEFLKGA